MQTNWKLEPLLKFSDSDKHLHPLPHAEDLSTVTLFELMIVNNWLVIMVSTVLLLSELVMWLHYNMLPNAHCA